MDAQNGLIKASGTAYGAEESVPTVTQNENESKTKVEDFYSSTTPENQSVIETLINQGSTNNDIVEYLQLKGQM
jgi:DNA-binding NarL/FixJ family response regulator